jgi:hypothetical protein
MSYSTLFEPIESSVYFDASDNCDELPRTCYCRSSDQSSLVCSNNNCLNVARQMECVECKFTTCCNQRFTKRLYANLEVILTENKGFGLVATNALLVGDFVIEFVGELISHAELLKRKADYAGHLLVMYLKEGTYIDATRKGSVSRFLNHSCDPNCRVEVWCVGSQYRVGIFAIKQVHPFDELTIDYEWEPVGNNFLTRCYCGSKNCRQVIEKLDQNVFGVNFCKRGVWRTPDELVDRLLPKLNLPSTADPLPLVGKRIKVWWDGNQSYFEADVLSYNARKAKYSLRYLVDNDIVDEALSIDVNLVKDLADQTQNCSEVNISKRKNASVSAPSPWLWLDETQSEKSIKKRVFGKNTEEEDLVQSPIKRSSTIHHLTSKTDVFVLDSVFTT